MKNRLKIFLLIAFIIMCLNSCTVVKEYEKSKLNDSEMQLSNRKIEKTENSFQTYREGASGGNGGKSVEFVRNPAP